ncbi:hypothetical protein VE00_09197 [Pseudogymnoascus sp. WSF 3629]|nr:hypothetical protein VE00_09197 [Pseudogymnoascus sp. WSF 3629]
MLTTGSVVGDRGKKEAVAAYPLDKLKIAFPNTFNRDRKKLKSFLIQVELWMAFNSKHFTQEGDEAICDQYYMGLKDHVKDEISRSNKPNDLKEMIKLA